MAPSADLLAQALGLAALIGATIEYIEIVHRRALRRIDREAAEAGLRGLVRLFAVNEAIPVGRSRR
jgi:hypothetical protein